jgi:hypothetical protein
LADMIFYGLPPWTHNICSCDHDGGPSTVVTDWKVQPVLLEFVSGTSEEAAEIEGVILGGEEIRVLAHGAGEIVAH